jgi:hypothetical protein
LGGREVSRMTDSLLQALEDELDRLRRLREAVLEVLANASLNRENKLDAIEHIFQAERDEDEESEELRDRERLS